MPSAGKPRVLVTGGAGYIGSHAVLALLDAGHEVTVIDNLETGFAWAVDPRARLVVGSIGDAPALADALEGVGAVMHFAGSIVVPESVADPLKYYRNNTAITRTLLEAVVAAGIPYFIFSSTAATYGVPEQIPIAESCPTQPINPYGRSKLMTEMMLADVAAAHPLSYCVLRYFNVAGADPEGRAGQSTAGATHLIKVAVEAALGKRKHVAVFGTDFPTPDGTGVRDYIHVSDLAAAHLSALQHLLAHPGENFTFNCGYGHGYSVLETLDAVDAVVGREVPRIFDGRRAGDPAELVADTSALLQSLSWRPRYDDLPTIIRHAHAWEKGLEERRRAATAKP